MGICITQKHLQQTRIYTLSTTQHKGQFPHKVIMAVKISEFNLVNMAHISRVKTHGLRAFLACPRVLL